LAMPGGEFYLAAKDNTQKQLM